MTTTAQQELQHALDLLAPVVELTAEDPLDACDKALRHIRTAIGHVAPKEIGATWFMRCAGCHTLWVPMAGWALPSGKDCVYWCKPRPVRNPKPCKHLGEIEAWNGTAWITASKRAEEQP
jgi:hypothetical protein